MSQKHKILIVDDEEKNIKLLKAILMSKDYELYGVFSGEEALKIVADTCPDLILLDVMMPGIDGFDVCRTLKQDERTRVIPVIMVTALREKEHRIKAMEAGADDFISKPVDQTELLIRVKSLLRIKSYHDNLLDSYREIAEKNLKLQELERVKEGLTHMIVHDLRNPLTAITSSLDLIMFDKQELSEKQLSTIERCLNYCRDFGELIQGLLDIHKMEEGKLELIKELSNLPKLMNDVLEQFMPKIELKQISLQFPKCGDVPFVLVDRRLLKRVIANLLNNAIRHTPKGGIIEVGINHVPEKRTFCVIVRDSGGGLASEYHEKIFDKFKQLELRHSNVAAGSSGLGLTFCKMAVEAHGGKIWVESEGEDKGCIFSFEIPVKNGTIQEPQNIEDSIASEARTNK